MLFCFQYDPATGRYTTAVLNTVRAAGVLTLVALGLFMVRSWRRDRARGDTGTPTVGKPAAGPTRQ
jgi:protein SCO1/2